MSDKVKLRKEAVEAIEAMRAKGTPNNEIVERHIEGDHILVNGVKSVDELSTDTLIRALYIGYEVEETPEDKVRALYKDYQKEKMWTACTHIETVLDLLGIKISEVNA